MDLGSKTTHPSSAKSVTRNRPRAIDSGTLAAKPGLKACDGCDFQVVCGSQEERRTRRKDPKLFADLDALRKMP